MTCRKYKVDVLLLIDRLGPTGRNGAMRCGALIIAENLVIDRHYSETTSLHLDPPQFLINIPVCLMIPT